ncbi:MAG: DUF177 domain-containing protein [candidate division Zixibacteria bacterium]
MKLTLNNINDFPAHLVLEGKANDLRLEYRGLVEAHSLQVEMDIILSDNIYYCQGQVKCDAKLECSRCLEPYSESLNGRIDFSIQELSDKHPVDTDEVPENEILLTSVTKEIDISQPIREALILEIPLKPICAESCRGLCSLCGGNKNVQQCDCRIENADSRWDNLKDLLIDQQSPDK